jgi:uncharacterized protein (TIGR02646 family)
MLLLHAPALQPPTLATLAAWQSNVDGQANYGDKVAAAKAEFKRYNTRQNVTFQEVKAGLTVMCSGARRCVYCEDSVADEVEHIAPKDLYPERVFSWDNYVYACGPCNGPKNNRYAVIQANGAMAEVTRKRRDPVVPPIAGADALINPRIENPITFFDVDLLGTFIMLPAERLSAPELLRAEFTLKVLDLNRDVLLKARANAYGSYRARLIEFEVKRNKGALQAELDDLVAGLKEMPHPTVFAEMQRMHIHIPELAAIFAKVPEALHW